ncbi:MAG: acylphosphatase [Candidatus Aenigmarchaeota archaeon]|nr:acylphosphatase [Candidatus Aenigmarchaeota archaeon]
MVKKRVVAVVHGKVQNVFFRKFVLDNAKALDLKGWVRNDYENNSVETLFEGEDDKVHEMINLLWKGPDGSDVGNVVIRKEDYKGDYDFFSIVS